jgi:hypothetical protein
MSRVWVSRTFHRQVRGSTMVSGPIALSLKGTTCSYPNAIWCADSRLSSEVESSSLFPTSLIVTGIRDSVAGGYCVRRLKFAASSGSLREDALPSSWFTSHKSTSESNLCGLHAPCYAPTVEPEGYQLCQQLSWIRRFAGTVETS